MIRLFMMLALCLLATSSVDAQVTAMCMDTVVDFTPGSGPATGRGPAFFPANVLRGPVPEATTKTPSIDAREVCSIGLNGTIVLGLRNHVIVDLPGVDFTVFENAFIGPTDKVYAEPGEVSVSKDGIHWIRVPFDSMTLEGCAGRTPTSGEDPFDPTISGGDSFDLSVLGIDSVRYVRIHDVTQIIKDNRTHPYYDPTLSGFDLDVIVAHHAVRIAETTTVRVLPRSTILEVSVKDGTGSLQIYDASGVLLATKAVPQGITEYSTDDYATTMLIAVLVTSHEAMLVKVLK